MIMGCFHLGNKEINSAINRNAGSHREADFEGNYDAFSVEHNKIDSTSFFPLTSRMIQLSMFKQNKQPPRPNSGRRSQTQFSISDTHWCFQSTSPSKVSHLLFLAMTVSTGHYFQQWLA